MFVFSAPSGVVIVVWAFRSCPLVNKRDRLLTLMALYVLCSFRHSHRHGPHARHQGNFKIGVCELPRVCVFFFMPFRSSTICYAHTPPDGLGFFETQALCAPYMTPGQDTRHLVFIVSKGLIWRYACYVSLILGRATPFVRVYPKWFCCRVLMFTLSLLCSHRDIYSSR